MFVLSTSPSIKVSVLTDPLSGNFDGGDLLLVTALGRFQVITVHTISEWREPIKFGVDFN